MRRVHYDRHFLLGLLAVISGCFSELYIGCRLDGDERKTRKKDNIDLNISSFLCCTSDCFLNFSFTITTFGFFLQRHIFGFGYFLMDRYRIARTSLFFHFLYE